MNEYLLADVNRQAIDAHNGQLIKVSTVAIGLDAEGTPSYDFNNAEEVRQLNVIADREDLETLTVTAVTELVYGTDDEHLKRRVRSKLKFNSAFQKQLGNGTAFVARQNGTLWVTRTPAEFGELATTSIAQVADRSRKSMVRSVKQIGAIAASTVDKVPELADSMGGVLDEVKSSLTTVFTRQLELLSGE